MPDAGMPGHQGDDTQQGEGRSTRWRRSTDTRFEAESNACGRCNLGLPVRLKSPRKWRSNREDLGDGCFWFEKPGHQWSECPLRRIVLGPTEPERRDEEEAFECAPKGNRADDEALECAPKRSRADDKALECAPKGSRAPVINLT